MELTLSEVLAAPVVQQARPEVLHGAHLLGRGVRWVHTSEIFGIASLLRGGEILVVSGLGLVGADDDALTTYVHRLVDRGVTALFFELGRTFDRVPESMVHAARRADIALVALHEVVPFVDITYAVHRLLLRQAAESALWIEDIDRQIHGALLAGEGLQEVLRRVEVLAGTRVELRDSSDRLVVASETSPSALLEGPGVSADVVVHGSRWGRVELRGGSTPHLRLLSQRAALAIGIALVMAQSWAANEENSSSKLLRDIVADRFVSADELNARARAIGFDWTGRRLVGLAMTVDATVAAPAARASVQDILGQTALVAELDGEILAGVAVSHADDARIRALATRLVGQMQERPAARGGGRVVALAAGHPVPTLANLGGSLATARDARTLMSHLGLEAKVLLSTEVTVYRLLARLSGEPESEQFVSEQLGRLVDHDATHGTTLLRTLEVLVDERWSKTRTAERLGVRRQTVYRRLAQVEGLVVGSLDDAESRVQLSLAMKARLVRSVGARS